MVSVSTPRDMNNSERPEILEQPPLKEMKGVDFSFFGKKNNSTVRLHRGKERGRFFRQSCVASFTSSFKWKHNTLLSGLKVKKQHGDKSGLYDGCSSISQRILLKLSWFHVIREGGHCHGNPITGNDWIVQQMVLGEDDPAVLKVFEITTRSRMEGRITALYGIPYILEDSWHVTEPPSNNRFSNAEVFN
ncbi:hypothetical protein TNCV_2577191 [Trichonephila clavipes]|nr:hypothetical protein TNCV_2577191 [Trichonephila clavipes]